MERANWLGEANYRLTRIQLVLSFAGALGLFYTLYLTREAIVEAKRGNQIAQAAHAVDQRPWVSVKSVSVTRCVLEERNPGRLRIELSVKLENTGRTPARNVAVAVALHQWGPKTWQARAQELVAAMEAGHAWAIAPDGEWDASADDTLDIGAAGASRVYSVYPDATLVVRYTALDDEAPKMTTVLLEVHGPIPNYLHVRGRAHLSARHPLSIEWQSSRSEPIEMHPEEIRLRQIGVEMT